MLSPVTGTVVAVHGANPSLELQVLEADMRRMPAPAVLSRGDHWYSAELMAVNGRLVAFAVNMYGDQATARRDAGRR